LIDANQKAMYRLCGINLIEFWDYTPAETYVMIDIAYDKLKGDTRKHAEILMWIANAPHIKLKQLLKLDELLPDFAKVTQELTPEDVERLWWNSI
jgi:hypothetical protein